MTMAYITGVKATAWPKLLVHWWQWALVSLCLGAILVGSSFMIFDLIGKLQNFSRQKKSHLSPDSLAKVSARLQTYTRVPPASNLEKVDEKKPASLRVYMGTFDDELPAQQAEVLTGRDMIILDPLQRNIVPSLANLPGHVQAARHIVGRLDLEAVLAVPERCKENVEVCISCVDQTLTFVTTRFQTTEASSNGFTGILLGGWEIFPTEILHELCDVIASRCLDVYLELSGPKFLEDPAILAAPSVAGVVIRNGLILPHGEHRDCFGMDALRTTVKAFVSQSCVRDFTVLAWETLDNGVVPSNAVLKRTFAWCNFYSVVSWIGSADALTDASSKDFVPFEPLSAFAWLKEPRVMDLHDMWKNKRIAQNSNHRHSAMARLDSMLPSLEAARKDCTCKHERNPAEVEAQSQSTCENMGWFVLKESVLGDPLCTSASGTSYDGIGCFPLGVDVSLDHFQEVVFSQRNLRKLELLDAIDSDELAAYGEIYTDFLTADTLPADTTNNGTLGIGDAIADLARSLTSSMEGVRVFLGLQSGFQCTSEKLFWSVYHVNPSHTTTDIYISKNVGDVMGTLLHTFLSRRGLTRRQCFEAEVAFASWNHSLLSMHGIPPRMGQDMEILSPEECIVLLQRVSLSPDVEEDALLTGIRAAALERVVDIPNWNQLKLVNTVGYLAGDVTVEELVESRLKWHCQEKRRHPSTAIAASLFNEVEAKITVAMRTRDHQQLQTVIDSLGRLLHYSAVSAIGDLLAVSVFCTMRKLAFEEVYIEVTDRNPLFNDQTDQAAAFAELFALGSRCEAYFDITPSQFGELLSTKFRSYYNTDLHQPPMVKESSDPHSSAYAEAQIDVDPKNKQQEMPAYQRFTFLSVFAIPALIDILMLTTTGHGLYLSGSNSHYQFMSHEEQHSATTALMISLILSGAIGTWITCGGTYYLASMAFSAMNYFVITRLIGGFAFTLVVGALGFIVFACKSTAYAGLIFFLYLVALTSYLSLLAALANYQFTGSAFQSGRAVIIMCIPILFASPVTTIFVPHHDIVIYLTVLYVFVTMLLLGVVRVGSKWTTWYQKISLLDDQELRIWFLEKRINSSTYNLEKLSEPAVLRLARQALLFEVQTEQKKHFWNSKSEDPLIARLVEDFTATEFLMNWYCQFSGVAKPMLYSAAWNVNTKAALFSLQKSQLGIRFHNGFLHWRQAGDEIGCTVLYFVVALLDKWVALIDGGQLVGLTSANVSLTMPVGFGLAYYLIGAVLLDFNANKLHELAASSHKEVIVPTDGDIEHATKVKSDNRRNLYWKTLGHYLMWHVWGLAVTSMLLWVFSSDSGSTGPIVFLSYVGAYTGLLWYQYTKVFSGPHALKPLLIGVAVGLPIGFILDHTVPRFPYSDIIALAASTWTVAILSLWAGKIVGPSDDDPVPMKSSEGSYHAYSSPGEDHAWSQPELQSLYDELSDLSAKERLLIDPDSDFGSQVKMILEQCAHIDLSPLAKEAFPDSDILPSLATKLFKERELRVELISSKFFSDRSMRAMSSVEPGSIRLLVACETKRVSKNQDPLTGFYWDVAELLVQVTAERYFAYTTHDALLARTLWLSNGVWNSSAGPDILERHLSIDSNGGFDVTTFLRKQLLKDLCLGFDLNLDSDNIPASVRQHIINRCLGVPSILTTEQAKILNRKLNKTPGLDFETYVARCNYAVFLSTRLITRVLAWTQLESHACVSSLQSMHDSNETANINVLGSNAGTVIDLLAHTSHPKYSIKDRVIQYSEAVYHYMGTLSKFFSIAFVADPEYQRELKCTFPSNKNVVDYATRFVLLVVWHLAKAIQRFFLPVFLFHRREKVKSVWQNLQGMEVSIRSNKRVTIRNIDGVSTGFIHPVDSISFRLLQYKGDHKTEPNMDNDLIAINLYSKNLSLLRRVEMEKGNTQNDYTYEYHHSVARTHKRISKTDLLSSPITRKGIAGFNNLQDISFNNRGQIDSGSYVKDGNLIRFQYHYQKTTRHSGALLRAEFVLPHMSCTVSWCAAPRRRAERLESWIPHSQVTEATFVVGADVWESKYLYDHKFHPTILTTLNGENVETPDLILYDHLDVLKKPKHISFLDDNPLYGFSTVTSNHFTRWLGLSTRKYPMSTAQARSWLWKAWKDDPAFDGVIVRWLDERLLRRDQVLHPYWRKRDFCQLEAAEEYLDKNRDAVMASADLDNSISSWTPLAVKINDLYSFGQGGDACSRTRSNVTAQEDDETALHVLAVDTGTWPNEGGGVSACRSDVINNLRTIKWHMVAESANDFGLPKRQIERNIHSLKVIPLWGLDLMTPTHGLFHNRLDSEVEHVTSHMTLLDIERTFVPVLTALISGARALDFTLADVKQVTRALVNLNSYFKDSRHWSAVWRSQIVKSIWRNLWLSQISENARPSNSWLKAELPTLGQLDQGLELWSRYLFIFSIPIPEKMPAVFQASHHSVSASYGIVCKIKRGCTLQIWDHAISWRETNLYLSSSLCPLSPFTRNSLLGLMRMTSVLTLHHADTILPCADFFNPNWEIEIGTCQGKIEDRSVFRRKIDPVVNGITNMERFAPVQDITTKIPTVTMLSHIWFAKDIKTAMLSADIIVNTWGFSDFRMEIYGALDKTPSYTTQCQEIVASKGLRHQVQLMGEADPIRVLKRTWLFLNSSVSEGLPLALGEAALTGAPVVCTDVGASLRVLTNPEDNTCYSAVVAPNDALAMARAQIKILALLEEWSVYQDPTQCTRETVDVSFPENPTAKDVARITKRMYEQMDARRALGMRSREIVQKSFSGDRYLREHEQMLWVGKARKDMNMPFNSRPSARLITPARAYVSDLTSQPLGAPRRSLQREVNSLSVRAESIRQGRESTVASTGRMDDILPSLAFGGSTNPTSIDTGLITPSLSDPNNLLGAELAHIWGGNGNGKGVVKTVDVKRSSRGGERSIANTLGKMESTLACAGDGIV